DDWSRHSVCDHPLVRGAATAAGGAREQAALPAVVGPAVKAGFAYQGIWRPFTLQGEPPARIEISERHCCQVIVFRLELDLRNSTDELKVYDVVERLVR